MEGPGVDAIGIIGGTTLALCLIPQLLKLYQTRSAADLSYLFLLLYSLGLSLKLVYYVDLREWPAAVPIMVELGMGSFLYVIKFFLDRDNRQKHSPDVQISELKVGDAPPMDGLDI